MSSIRIPRVAVSRRIAANLATAVEINEDEPVILDGRGLVVNNDVFALQLAQDLKERNLAGVIVMGGSPQWHRAIQSAGQQLDFSVTFREVA